MQFQVEELDRARITLEYLRQLSALSCAVFPSPTKTEDSALENLQRAWCAESEDEARRCYIVREKGVIVTSASITPRWIGSSAGRIRVAGLCGVMCYAELRGRGYGKAVVLKAFENVDSGKFEFSLFQTGEARGFYEKLGCCVVRNRIVNSLNRDAPHDNPLWDPWPMRYPCAGDWPEGTIDLLGPAY
jgi:hypothetical protein